MTHQIILLGGQLVPVYVGITERKPDIVHILYTNETKKHKTVLTKQIQEVAVFDYQVDPYDYVAIQETVTAIINKNKDAEFELNLTSGTKLMALASQQIFNTRGYFSFYIDQKQNMIDITKGTKNKINSLISIETFLALSNHNTFTSNTLQSFNTDELALAHSIFELRKKRSGIGVLSKLLRAKAVDSAASEYFFDNSGYKISWKNNLLSVKAPRFTLNAKGKNAFKILTTGLWWELIVAQSVNNWKSANEILMSVAIKSNKDISMDKNEIDILINTGQIIFFIECKSGMITQSDLNKINTVSKFYGGINAKSILVSFFKPKEYLLEKCRDFGIEVFYLIEKSSKNHKLSSLTRKLDRLLKRGEL